MSGALSEVRRWGFTLLELLAAIAIITVIASLLLPALAKAKERTKRAACSNNLRVLGVAMNGFAADHEDRYPMALIPWLDREPVPGLGGATTGAGFVLSAKPFFALSNDLTSPKVLVCPTERRQPALNFPSLQPSHLSYALSLNGRPGDVRSPVATDRNLTNLPMRATPPQGPGWDISLGWTRLMHTHAGHVLLGDGHVEFLKNLRIPGEPPMTSPPARSAAASPGRQAGAGQAASPGAPPQSPSSPRAGSPATAGGSGAGAASAVGGHPKSPGRAPVPEGRIVAATNGVAGTATVVSMVGDPAEDVGFATIQSAAKWGYLACLLWALLVLLAYYLRHRERARRRRGMGSSARPGSV